MKILEKKDHSEWAKELDCHGCESKLEVSSDDISLFANPDPRDSGPDYTVRCPVCNAMLWVQDVPQAVRNYINRRNSGSYSR